MGPSDMQAHEVLFTKTQAAILTLLFTNPRRRHFANELVRLARVGRGAIQREIRRLRDADLIVETREGKRIYYQANPRHFVFPEVAGLIQKTTGPVGRIHQAFERLRKRIDVAFIYGSVACGSETPESDIDLMVIGSVDFRDVVKVTSPLTHELLRETNPSVFPKEEFKRRLKEGNPFLKRVVAGLKLFVIGDENVVSRLAEE
ncbi:MAG: nucleotidyltransferase domain-containing protein [Thermodesulfobacteriota bacterium]